ncbi:phosphoenolpyruvate--protein phosphotransferase [Treponema sp.]|uniref:phosphoenolpyruvate--protein phosphotransferase n=1 Tax=Treponema sp. TaxID=166 RepID=UPI0025CF1CCD|nr:phosphoenolpyruvate--protein phosphotransferase [Treponema sp.]MCR5218540.1 phosphoenolpyruvate--protein phosphotransferase [Treponema sp.]
MNVLLGISASSGTGIGKAFVLPETPERIISKNKLSDNELESEWQRFESACTKVKESIEKSLSEVSAEDLNRVILETYLLMLADPVFLQEVKAAFEKNKYNIEYIVDMKAGEYADRLRNSGNDYLAERAGDIEDVFGKVLDILLDYHPFDIEEVPENAVIVGRNMKTSDTVILNKRKIAGLALIEGGISSHVAILARTYGIPAVVGLEGITSQVENGEQIIVDGSLGEVVVSPDSATLMQSQSKIAAEQKRVDRLKQFRNKAAMTEDGVEFKLYANIGTPEEAEIALEEGADGIGLFRTEFLFMDSMKSNGNKNASYSNSVSEEVQFQAYKRVLEIMGDKPVTIRTLDSGGDKDIGTKEIPFNSEKNPLMGLRAIRHSLFYPQIFRTQLRALYRASVYGNLRIMLPLITDVSQVDTVRGIIKGVQYSLKEDNIPFKADVPVGIMVETAAAAICADCFASHCDFFSLGTNDLTQYTIGIDRENPSVAPYYNEFNLAVLRLIKMTIDAAKKEGIPVSICGEMAGKKESVIILAGFGIRSLSMAPKQISVIKEILSQFSMDELESLSSNSLF